MQAIPRRVPLALIILVAMTGLAVVGCGQGTLHFVEIPMLAPFQGKWQFDEEQTLDAWRAAGASDDQIAKTQAIYKKLAEQFNSPEFLEQMRAAGVKPADMPHASGKIHPDITIAAHVVSAQGSSMEYSLFGLHQHGEVVCGKAWHHEDKNDPGDMSKCDVQLSIVDGALNFIVHMRDDGQVDVHDPDIRSPAIVADADTAATCTIKASQKGAWGEWLTYVFVRPAKEAQ